MKYSNIIGITAALVLIFACFQPWIYIESISITMTGMNKAVKNYGKPGLFSIVFSIAAIAFYITPKIWTKRANLFICSLNIAWAIRNLIIISACDYGDCPKVLAWIYIYLFCSIVMIVAALLPDLTVKNKG